MKGEEYTVVWFPDDLIKTVVTSCLYFSGLTDVTKHNDMNSSQFHVQKHALLGFVAKTVLHI